MKFYKENYGADADGNRGTASISCEIEDSDSTEICEKLYDLFLDGIVRGEHNIFMYCYLIDDEIKISVNIEDYIDNLIKMAENDDDLKEDDELQKFIIETKIKLKNMEIKKLVEKRKDIILKIWKNIESKKGLMQEMDVELKDAKKYNLNFAKIKYKGIKREHSRDKLYILVEYKKQGCHIKQEKIYDINEIEAKNGK